MNTVKHIDTCPYCGSHNVQDRITEVQCLTCGSLDTLVGTEPSWATEMEVLEAAAPITKSFGGYADTIEGKVVPVEIWGKKPKYLSCGQWDEINKLKGLNRWLQNKNVELDKKLKEHTDMHKAKAKKNKYTLYNNE